MKYQDFIASKHLKLLDSGFDCPDSWMPGLLKDWQSEIVLWAIRKGRAAMFEECGLGKTAQQLAWASAVHRKTGGDVLILAPLAVSQQTVSEGIKFDVHVNLARTADDLRPGINIANYERLHHFDASFFAGVVLDESSILKSLNGKTKTRLVESFSHTPYRLCCTATPAPNDYIELGNHAEFLGIMSTSEMLARWFVNDGFESGKWRLKGHAHSAFWEWVSSWAVCVSKPSDVGEYSDDGFILPELETIEHQIRVDGSDFANGMLIKMHRTSASDIKREMRHTIAARVSKAADVVKTQNGEPCVIWCELNDESTALCRAIPGAVEITGGMDTDRKESILMQFSTGEIQCLITKPRIAGFGLNWQHCRNIIFVGCSYSFEARYQAVRRCWRFGQTKKVFDHVILAGSESKIFDVVKEKERKFLHMRDKMSGGFMKASDTINGQAGMVKYRGKESKLPSFLQSRCA